MAPKGAKGFLFLNRLLFEPSKELAGSDRRQARLLSGMLFFIAALLAASLFFESMPVPHGRIVLAFGAAALFGLYFLSRTRFYLTTAGLTVAVFTVMSGALYLMTRQTSTINSVVPVVWLILPTLIGSIFLPLVATAASALVVIAGLALSMISLPPVFLPEMISGLLFLVVFSVMLVLIGYHRRAVERENLQTIRQSFRNAEAEIRERIKAQTELAAQAEHLNFLREIDILILEATPLDEILIFIRNKIRKETGRPYAAVLLFDAGLAVATVLGNDPENPGMANSLSGQTFPLGELDPDGIVAGKIEEGRSSFVMDVDSMSLPEAMEREIRQAKIGAFLFIFVKIEENIIGLFAIGFNRASDVDEKILLKTTEIANQASIAIQNDRMRTGLKEHAMALEKSLMQKEVLLKEVHHRVKNNLQVISSLLYLQSQKADNKNIDEIFRDLQNRVRSIVVVHERLYQSADLARIWFADYVTTLVRSMMSSYAIPPDKVNFIIGKTDIQLDADLAVPIGLIITELVSNALKYAFPGDRTGTLSVDFLTDEEGLLELTVSDDGIGMAEGFDPAASKTMGLQIVDVLSQQVGASLSVTRTKGTAYTFSFSRQTPPWDAGHPK
jgi:two-component sensor histidine kinase